MKRIGLAVGILVAVVGVAALTELRDRHRDPQVMFDEARVLLANAGPAIVSRIDEGLPHPSNENEIFNEELRKPHRTQHGHEFYAQPLRPSADEIAKLRETLLAEDTYEKWGPGKKCGGFHPDLLVELQTTERTIRILLCFGCGEAKFVDGSRERTCDIRHEAEATLRAWVDRNRQSRPRPKRW